MFDILAVCEIKDCNNLSSYKRFIIKNELQGFLYNKDVFNINDISKNFSNIKIVWG